MSDQIQLNKTTTQSYIEEDETQKKVNNKLLMTLQMFEGGEKKDNNYQKNKKDKKNMNEEVKLAHEWHLMLLNGIIETSKDAIDAGYDIPKEIIAFLTNYIYDMKNTDKRNKQIAELKKFDINNASYKEKSFFEFQVFGVINGHKAGIEKLKEEPYYKFKGGIENSPFASTKNNLSNYFCGYELAITSKKIRLENFKSHLIEELSTDNHIPDEKTIRNKLKFYNLEIHINNYLEEIKEVKE